MSCILYSHGIHVSRCARCDSYPELKENPDGSITVVHPEQVCRERIEAERKYREITARSVAALEEWNRANPPIQKVRYD